MNASAPCASPGITARRQPALTLIELLVIVMLLTLVVAVLLPSRGRAICGSIRLVCASNVKGIGTAMKIYANDYDDAWPVVPFDETAIGSIDYTVAPGSGAGSVRSPSRTQMSTGGPGGTRQLSVTRALWMLVRSGEVTPKSFICPTSGDAPAGQPNIDRYYDFAGPSTISYGFQVPFGPPLTRASEAIDPRVGVAADKGPYVNAGVPPPTTLPPQQVNTKNWRAFNSRNHGSEGQNVLYGDGHATFTKTPFVGVDRDNIHTVALGNSDPTEYVLGESPWLRSVPPFAPHDAEGVAQCTTDSLISP